MHPWAACSLRRCLRSCYVHTRGDSKCFFLRFTEQRLLALLFPPCSKHSFRQPPLLPPSLSPAPPLFWFLFFRCIAHTSFALLVLLLQVCLLAPVIRIHCPPLLVTLQVQGFFFVHTTNWYIQEYLLSLLKFTLCWILPVSPVPWHLVGVKKWSYISFLLSCFILL